VYASSGEKYLTDSDLEERYMLRKIKKHKASKLDSLVGKNSCITGDISFSGGLHVDGVIKGAVSGEVESLSSLTVSEHGTIEGQVRVPCIFLNGLVKGDVYSAEGNVYYGLMEMAIGAEVNGKLVRISEDDRPELSLDFGGAPPQED
jgi:cytoskeletal protein CcmA (bactofilin family)